jgi:hypothetical protein
LIAPNSSAQVLRLPRTLPLNSFFGFQLPRTDLWMVWLVWHSGQFVFDRRQSDSIIPALSDPIQTIRWAIGFSVFLKKICWNVD